MPILQSTNGTADVIGGLAGLAAQFIQGNLARKQAQQKRDDLLKQQGITNQNAANQTAIDANNAGMVVGPDGKVAPWKPPAPAAPSTPTQQPGIAGMLAGLAQPPPQANLGPKAPTLGAPVSQGVMNALPASVTGQQPQAGQPQPPPNVPPELIHTASVSQAMADHLTQLAQGEQQQADTLTSQGAPAVIIKRHTDAAKGYLTDAGEQTAKYLDAQKQIGILTGVAAKNAKADAQQRFVSKEMTLPSDPKARRSVLLKRIGNERAAGVDTKPTQDLIAEADRQITDAENRAQQARTAGQRDQTIKISLDRAAGAGGRAAAAAGDPQSYSDVSGRIAKVKTRDQAQAILDSPEGGLLSDRQYNRLQKQVDETYGTHAQVNKPVDTGKSTLQRVQGSAGYKAIPAQYQTVITAELKKGATVDGIRSMVNTSKMDDTSKKLIITALNGL